MNTTIVLTTETLPVGSAAQIALFAVLAAVAIAAGVFTARSKADERILLLVYGIVLIISEVIKGIWMTRFFGCYSWSDFPFQLCSIPMYFCVLYFFFRKLWIEHFIMVYSLIGAAASFLVPEATIADYTPFTVHSLFWHASLLFLGVFLAVRQTPEKMRMRNYPALFLTYLILAGIAVCFNAAFLEVSGGTMNMFFLGPGWPNMFILNDIWEKSGWVAATLGMIGVSEAAGLVVYLVIRFFTVKFKTAKTA